MAVMKRNSRSQAEANMTQENEPPNKRRMPHINPSLPSLSFALFFSIFLRRPPDIATQQRARRKEGGVDTVSADVAANFFCLTARPRTEGFSLTNSVQPSGIWQSVTLNVDTNC